MQLKSRNCSSDLGGPVSEDQSQRTSLRVPVSEISRVSVQGVRSLGGHFACLCRGFDFYEVKKNILFFKKKREIFYTFNHFYSEKSSKRAK